MTLKKKFKFESVSSLILKFISILYKFIYILSYYWPILDKLTLLSSYTKICNLKIVFLLLLFYYFPLV